MILIYNGNNHKLEEAVYRSNQILMGEGFYSLIRGVATFTYTDASPHQIANALKRFHDYVEVREYSNFWTRSNGYFTPQYPRAFFINTRRLNRPINSIVNTCIHESVHVVDHFDARATYGHKGNSSAGNENSAPYAIGRIAEHIADNLWPRTEDVYHKYKPTIWQRFKNFLRRIF